MEATNAAPWIVTLILDRTSFERLDAWRASHFPSERNFLSAHITLFHALPSLHGSDVEDILRGAAEQSGSISLTFARLVVAGSYVGVEVEAPEARALKRRLNTSFQVRGIPLTRQDAQGLRPHVTLVNKGGREYALRAAQALRTEFSSWQGEAEGLGLWRYEGGPWTFLKALPFARSASGQAKRAPGSDLIGSCKRGVLGVSRRWQGA